MLGGALIALLISIGPAACIADETETACSLIGCAAPLEVRFHASAWPAGTYAVEVTADGVAASCEIAVPFGCEDQATCTPAQPTWMLELSGCALPSGQQEILGVMFPDHASPPASVDVTVRRDGQVLATGHYERTYTTWWPNGPDCGPECRATEPGDLALP